MVSTGAQPDFEQAPASPGNAARPRRSRRPQRRHLSCPVHPESRLMGSGRKYFLHLLTPEELKERGISDKRVKLVIQAYPVLVLTNEWLEQLWCPDCCESRWCHVVQHNRVHHTVSWAHRGLWEQVAHVDPVVANPSVSEFSRLAARRGDARRRDGRRYWDG